jgi:EAL domain-containing protein (putative c-di-GMP-specific phosphodiesterase class I)/GGDEF domain-containing protein
MHMEDNFKILSRPPWFNGLFATSPAIVSTFDSKVDFLSRIAASVNFAFQPIVNIFSGTCYGYEALLRGHGKAGLSSIQAVFDTAHEFGCLHGLDLLLRDMALADFSRMERPAGAKLFFNLDQRVLLSRDYLPDCTEEILDRHGLTPETFCIELSERFETSSSQHIEKVISSFQDRFFKLAIDDFGAGFSGLKLLYDHHPDYIKIDRYFISGIARDNKRKLFVSTIVNLAHVLGVVVIAEGIETEEELAACREVGCDFAQGYFISRPMEDISKLRKKYEEVERTVRGRRRDDRTSERFISEHIEPITPLCVDQPAADLFEAFRRHSDKSFLPVVDAFGHPVGIVREVNFKKFAYSPYGKELIANKNYGKNLRDFVTPCLSADISTPTDTILEMFSLTGNAEGIIIVDGLTYAGFLGAASLLRAVNDKNLAQARDQSPLSRLPGNNSVNAYLLEAMDDIRHDYCLVYLDFDNFKPLNDHYGFRQGDRAILLFAELMRKQLEGSGAFLGHVGGDDFFIGFCCLPFESARKAVEELTAAFWRDVESFYDSPVREAGFLEARDRNGVFRRFPLLSCSAAILRLRREAPRPGPEEMATVFAELKKNAKLSPTGICEASLA